MCEFGKSMIGDRCGGLPGGRPENFGSWTENEPATFWFYCQGRIAPQMIAAEVALYILAFSAPSRLSEGSLNNSQLPSLFLFSEKEKMECREFLTL